MTSWASWAEGELDALRALHRLRRTVAFDGVGPEGVVEGRCVVAFASNDYLGLASHPAVRAAAQAALERFGAGATASRLVVGTRSLHEELETRLARWKGAERALVFSSGYAANIGVVASLGQADVSIFSDALNHASIIDGCRLAKAQTKIYRHCDIAHLEELMQTAPGKKIVVTETVFSMDGDRPPLDALARLCARHGALLVLDEAHDVLPAPYETHGAEIVHVGTLSKTLGALGGFAAGSRSLIELLVNRARTFIFTTGLSPPDAAAALCALGICAGAEGEALRARLRGLIDVLRPGHASAIIPVVLGSDAAALAAAQRLLQLGLYAPAIRPPTVPVGTARLRIALSALHTSAMVEALREALETLR